MLDALTKRDILSEHYWRLSLLLWPIRTRHGGNTWPYNQRMGPASRTMKYIHEVHLSWLVTLQSSLKWSWYHFSVLRYHVQIFKSFRDIQSFTAIIFPVFFLPSIWYQNDMLYCSDLLVTSIMMKEFHCVVCFVFVFSHGINVVEKPKNIINTNIYICIFLKNQFLFLLRRMEMYFDQQNTQIEQVVNTLVVTF